MDPDPKYGSKYVIFSYPAGKLLIIHSAVDHFEPGYLSTVLILAPPYFIYPIVYMYTMLTAIILNFFNPFHGNK